MFATSGPVVLAWLQRRLKDVHAVRATTPPTIVICATTALAIIATDGALADRQLWLRWLGFISLAVIAVLLGNRLARYLSPRVLARVVNLMLVASGVSLIFRAMA